MPGRIVPASQQAISPSPAVAAIRWGVVIVGLLFASVTMTSRHTFVLGTALLAHAMWRTAKPRSGDLAATLVAVINEVALTLVVIALTGWFRSPFVVALIAPLAAAMHTRSVIRAIEARESLARDQLLRLTEANTLLSELQDVTRALPTSLDLRDAINTMIGQLRSMFEPNAVALLLRDEAAGSWTVMSAVGTRLPRTLSDRELPKPLREALGSPAAIVVEHLRHVGGGGVSNSASTGMYAALRARDRIVGLIALERIVPGTLVERDRALLDGFLEQAAMAIDNARIFGRLRRIGADEERTRIARDLHDRVGQGLAYLSFELDRIGSQAGDPVQTEIATLRSDVRQILGEVRETLSDIRTDVSEQQDLVGTVDAFITRMGRRSHIHFEFEHDGRKRLPLPIEREMWRIAQEALANAERHSGASLVRVRWHCADHTAVLEVTDDGAGMSNTYPLKPGSFGLVGMRERADAIGAALEIDSEVGRGTTVRCMLESRERAGGSAGRRAGGTESARSAS